MQINQQLPQRIERDPEGRLLVHSIFDTIQGEGPFAGQAALFIRLHGCNLQCPGCDTDYTSNKQRYTPESLLAEAAGRRRLGDLIVITGGEPFRQNITPSVRLLLQYRFRVQIETNGLFYPGEEFPFNVMATGMPGVYELQHGVRPAATIVCSPKTGRIHHKLAPMVDAYKYVLQAGHVAHDGLPTTALSNEEGLGSATCVARPPQDWRGTIYLQPMDEQDEAKNAANVQACVDSVLTHHGLTLGFQMHKSVNLP